MRVRPYSYIYVTKLLEGGKAMRKKLMALVMAAVFVAPMGALAKTCKGTIKEFDGKTMVIAIKGKCKAETGQKVKIKVQKKAAVEGC